MSLTLTWYFLSMIESDEKIAAVSLCYAKVKSKKKRKDAYSNVQKKERDKKDFLKSRTVLKKCQD